jgi:transcriptional regulator with XRE-family HTH domain
LDFRDRIDRLLLDKKWKKPQLAEAAEVNYSTIKTWYNRPDSVPNARDLLLVAKTLNTTVEYLMTGKKSLQKSENQDPIAGKLLNYINGLDHDRLVETKAILTFYNGLTLQPEILTQGGKQNRKEA